MSKKTNAPSGCDPVRGISCNCLNSDTDCHCRDHPQQIQPPCMGSELRVSLGDYCKELNVFYEKFGTRTTLSMIDCCNLLLIESDRSEGRQS